MFRRLTGIFSIIALLTVLQACTPAKDEGTKPAPNAQVEQVEPSSESVPSADEDRSSSEEKPPTTEEAPTEEDVSSEEGTERLDCGVLKTAASAYDENGKELAKLQAADPVGVADKKPAEEGNNKGRIEVRLLGEENLETGKAWIDADAVEEADTCG